MHYCVPAIRERPRWLTPFTSTWVELLRSRASLQPANEAFLYAPDGDRVIDRRDFAAIDRRARSIAAALQRAAAPGARVLCLYRERLEFVDALFGCFYAGMIAVPTYPPRPPRAGTDQHWLRVESIRSSCTPSLILADTATAEALTGRDCRGLPVLVTGCEQMPDALADDWRPPEISADTVCLLQYTSGSTSDPRGVVLTHGRLLANSAAIYEAFGHAPESRGVLWLPHEHDMGLVGAVMQPVYACGPTLLMSPVHFVQEPRAWLEAISRHGATTSGGPNFAYQMCVERVRDEELDGLDLSSWEVAFVGAEPVRATTLDAFARRFEPAGFRRSAFLPCYGLAEATLIVTGSPNRHGANTISVSRSALERGDVNPAAAADDATDSRLVGCAGVVRCADRLAGNATNARRECGRRDPRHRALGRARLLGERRQPDVRRRRVRHGAAHRRSRIHPRRRAVRHRPSQGRHHRGRRQPLSRGHRALDRRLSPPICARALGPCSASTAMAAKASSWCGRRADRAATPSVRRWPARSARPWPGTRCRSPTWCSRRRRECRGLAAAR